MKRPENYEEALKQIRKLKVEQVLVFIGGMIVGTFVLLMILNKGL